jgi:hypothetical protein
MSEPEMSAGVKPVRWYFRRRFVLVMLFIFGPFVFPLVWFSPKFSLSWKIWTTIITVVLTWLLWNATVPMVQMLTERLKDIQSASTM